MLKKILIIIGTFLLYPFTKHLLFFIAFFVLGTSPLFLWPIISNNYFSLTLLTHCLVFSYLVTLIVGLIRHNATRGIIIGLVIFISAIFFGLNTYGIFVLDSLVDEDHLMLILDTNPNEAKEFLSNLLPLRLLLGITLVYISFFALWIISKRRPIRLGVKWSHIAMICICISSFKSFSGWSFWVEGPIKYLTELFTSLKEYETINESDLNHVLPTIAFTDSQQLPNNVVLIIGESFARFHSSLYGYEKPTNPCLSALHEESLLFTLDSIDTPAPTTSLSIQFMLSTCRKSDLKKQNKRWYDFPSVLELMKKCGYNCYWFSNQARSGKFNYGARIFAKSCDTSFFYQQEGSIRLNTRHDIVLVDSSYHFIKRLSPRKHNFIIYHMMGSHIDYSMRYPEDFAQFSEKDYATKPQSHRSILASYDNSILYNDYVVGQIINLYKDKDAIVIYIPDHGQVMYRDPKHPNHHIHGNMNDKLSYALGVEVPFMIYASPLYQEKHPEVMQRIKYRQDHPKAWNSDDLPYLIMDLIGVKDINGECIQSKSVLN